MEVYKNRIVCSRDWGCLLGARAPSWEPRNAVLRVVFVAVFSPPALSSRRGRYLRSRCLFMCFSEVCGGRSRPEPAGPWAASVPPRNEPPRAGLLRRRCRGAGGAERPRRRQGLEEGGSRAHRSALPAAGPWGRRAAAGGARG